MRLLEPAKPLEAGTGLIPLSLPYNSTKALFETKNRTAKNMYEPEVMEGYQGKSEKGTKRH